MKKNIQFLICFLAVLFLSSCVLTKVKIPPSNGIQGYSGSNTDTISMIAKANSIKLKNYETINPDQKISALNWGLAMSGGGIRSASVNIGALKALYDMGLLDSIDVISSVSGGSYAAGWFLTNEISNQTGKTGNLLFDNQYILKNIAHLQDGANMYRTSLMLGSLFKTPTGAFNKYKSRICRTFEAENLTNKNLNRFQSYVNAGKIPSFIINTTVSVKKNNPWLPSVFEYSPFYRGNPEIKFQNIISTNEVGIDEAVTMSGAAVKFKLLKKTENYAPDCVIGKCIPLSDGGRSENLGAIALIRRGVKNIIIIDAEYNKNYSFDGYKILKEKLSTELSMNLSIPTIDAFIDKRIASKNKDSLLTSVHKGIIDSIYIDPDYTVKPFQINVYYVKMALPKSLDTLFNDEVFINNGYVMDIKIRECIDSLGKKCDYTSIIKKEGDFYALSAYQVKEYAEWLNDESIWRFIKYTFPHTKTTDQSYKRDQLAAFIGLGYMQTIELKNILPGK